MDETLKIAKKAKEASYALALMDENAKNKVLYAIADALTENAKAIIEANKKDVKRANENGVAPSLIDRLFLDEKRISAMAKGVRDVAKLSDPIGETIGGEKRPNGISIIKRRVPLGVLAIIYEARPNVTSDAVALAVKTSNAVILKGGKDALDSNAVIMDVMKEAAKKAGYPDGAMELIRSASREEAAKLMTLNGYVDVIIPRGGAGLINYVVKNATVPVIETGVGNCHIFVDKSADFEMAKNIIINAKTQRPGVCNAMESLLIHEDIVDDFAPYIYKELLKKGVEVVADEKICKLCSVHRATEEDYAKEYLSLKLSAKTVKDVFEACAHINKYGTHHSEAIITNDYNNAGIFQLMVDSAAVYVNASTRFTDGGEFGFGAEIGISTQKLHARGPMGLKELTTYKYLINGNGQIR